MVGNGLRAVPPCPAGSQPSGKLQGRMRCQETVVVRDREFVSEDPLGVLRGKGVTV